MASVTSFSRVPRRPRAPESSPPCPASMAMMTSRSILGALAFSASFTGSFALAGSSFTTGSAGVSTFGSSMGAVGWVIGALAISPMLSGRGARSANSGSEGFAG